MLTPAVGLLCNLASMHAGLGCGILCGDGVWAVLVCLASSGFPSVAPGHCFNKLNMHRLSPRVLGGAGFYLRLFGC